MRTLALLVLMMGCEHDPRFEKHHGEKRPDPAPAVRPPETAPAKTIERPPMIMIKTITAPAKKHRAHHH